MMAKEHKTSGQSLIEILVAIGVTGIVLASVAALIYVGLLASRTSRENAYAQMQIQDMSSAVRGLAAIDWRAMWGSNGLVGYWGFNEGSGTRIYEPAYGNNGTTTGGISWIGSTNCKAGTCIDFNGTDASVDVGNGITLTSGITNALTVTAWVKPGTLNQASGNRDAAAQYGGGSNGWILRTSDNGNGRFTPYVYVGGSWYNCSGPILAIDTWVHLALTYDGETLSGYVNGNPTPVCQNTLPSGNLAMTGPTTIGSAYGAEYFDGVIDEVRIYNRALSGAEIQAMYATAGGLYPKSLGGFWTVYEGAESIPTTLFGTFSRWYRLDGVQRDSSGNIVSSGGTPDPSTVKVTYVVRTPRGRTISTTEYVTRSESRVTVQTDWSGGPNAVGTYNVATDVFATSSNIDATSTPGEIKLKGT